MRSCVMLELTSFEIWCLTLKSWNSMNFLLYLFFKAMVKVKFEFRLDSEIDRRLDGIRHLPVSSGRRFSAESWSTKSCLQVSQRVRLHRSKVLNTQLKYSIYFSPLHTNKSFRLYEQNFILFLSPSFFKSKVETPIII